MAKNASDVLAEPDFNTPRRSAIHEAAFDKAMARRGLEYDQLTEAQFKALTAEADEAEAHAVFGFDAKTDRHGEFVEQGIGSKGHETANHFAAILSNEMRGMEEPGAHQRALAEIWARDPKRAAALRLPRPRPKADEKQEKVK